MALAGAARGSADIGLLITTTPTYTSMVPTVCEATCVGSLPLQGPSVASTIGLLWP